MSELKIAWACITLNRLSELKLVLDRMAGTVDYMIVIDGGSVDDTIHYLRGRNDVHYRIVPWSDNFSGQRNQYIEEARKFGVDWLFVSDTDELYSADTAMNLRLIAERFEEYGLGGMELRCEEVGLAGDKEVYRKGGDEAHSFYKYLGMCITPSLRYEGNPHEGLVRADAEFKPLGRAFERFYYEHRKQMGVIAHRGARNFFISGGGMNERPAKWREFRSLVYGTMDGCNMWPAFDRAMVNGTLAPLVERWIFDHRYDDERPGDSETREMYLTYFRILHPEKDPCPNEHIKGQECSLPGRII